MSFFNYHLVRVATYKDGNTKKDTLQMWFSDDPQFGEHLLKSWPSEMGEEIFSDRHDHAESEQFFIERRESRPASPERDRRPWQLVGFVDTSTCSKKLWVILWR